MSTTLTSGIDPASFSAVTAPAQDLFRYVNGPWIDMYRLPDDRSRYGSFDKLAEDAENQIHDILEDDDCPAVKSRTLFRSFLDVNAIDASGLTAIADQLNAIDEATDKAGLVRYGSCLLPMDETLALCAVDLGGRPYFVYDAAFAGQSCGGMDTQMAREFFYAVSYSAMMNLHLKVLYGENDHHKLEAMFKAFAKALDAATRKDPRIDGVLSTKGTL